MDYSPETTQEVKSDYQERIKRIDERIEELKEVKVRLKQALNGKLHFFIRSLERSPNGPICEFCGKTEAHPIHPQLY